MIIGRITKVDGVKVVGTFYEKLPPYLFNEGIITPAPQINSYVKTNVGLDTIICQIVGEHEFEYDKYPNIEGSFEKIKENFMVDLEVRGRVTNNQFLGGLRCLPIVGASIDTLSTSDYSALFGHNDGLEIGTNLFDSSTTICLDPNRLIPSHIGIFGNTGSGKSNTLSRLLREYIQKIPPDVNNAHVIIFDLNNEYGNDAIISKESKTIYCLNTQHQASNADRIPLNIECIKSDNWGTLLRATQKTQMPIVRRAYKRWKKNETDYSYEIKKLLVNKSIKAITTLRENADEFFPTLMDFEYHKINNSFRYTSPDGTKYYCDTIEKCPEIPCTADTDLNRFLLSLIFEIAKASESGTNFDYIQPLISRAQFLIHDLVKLFDLESKCEIEYIYGDKPMVVIQLGNVDSGVRELIPSLLSELFMLDAIDKKADGPTKSITTLVIDEAHNLLSYDPDKSDLIHDNTIRVFEKIIKEGRKFGMFLCLSSQRPSDISETITSQIHNYFIHKLVNPRDIDRIRKTVSFMGDSSLSMLSALGQGECIISGPSLYMPQYVSVRELGPLSKPNSNDIKLFGESGILNGGKSQ